jgi:glutamine amidotransferase
MKITIVDYGMGNIKSIVGALQYLEVEEVIVSNSPSDLASADKLILPGVGSFSMAMNNIKRLDIDKHLREAVILDSKPILGICLGMQLMGESSTECVFSNGLGFIDSTVCEFKSSNFKVPHIGFNQVDIVKNSKLFKGLDNFSDFYFVHSYRMISENNINQSICHYGNDFIASYEKDNIAGVQFHPELSQTNGLKLLDNFIKYF